MEKKKNEELQSRREFFKKAAKGALPILAAVVLASAPSIMKAAETPKSCINSCSGSCSVVCADSCAGNCKGSCKYGCSTTCSGTCSGSSK